jgi:hypothetical protein
MINASINPITIGCFIISRLKPGGIKSENIFNNKGANINDKIVAADVSKNVSVRN